MCRIDQENFNGFWDPLKLERVDKPHVLAFLWQPPGLRCEAYAPSPESLGRNMPQKWDSCRHQNLGELGHSCLTQSACNGHFMSSAPSSDLKFYLGRNFRFNRPRLITCAINWWLCRYAMITTLHPQHGGGKGLTSQVLPGVPQAQDVTSISRHFWPRPGPFEESRVGDKLPS